MLLDKLFQKEVLTKLASEYPQVSDLAYLYPKDNERYPVYLANLFYLQECGLISDKSVLVIGSGVPEYKLGYGRITAKGLNFLQDNPQISC